MHAASLTAALAAFGGLLVCAPAIAGWIDEDDEGRILVGHEDDVLLVVDPDGPSVWIVVVGNVGCGDEGPCVPGIPGGPGVPNCWPTIHPNDIGIDCDTPTPG